MRPLQYAVAARARELRWNAAIRQDDPTVWTAPVATSEHEVPDSQCDERGELQGGAAGPEQEHRAGDQQGEHAAPGLAAADRPKGRAGVSVVEVPGGHGTYLGMMKWNNGATTTPASRSVSPGEPRRQPIEAAHKPNWRR